MAEHTCHILHATYDDTPEAFYNRPRTPLVVVAVNGAGQPLALACPLCRAQYDTDGQLIGKPDTWRPLTDAKDFTGAAGRLIDAGVTEQGEIA